MKDANNSGERQGDNAGKKDEQLLETEEMSEAEPAAGEEVSLEEQPEEIIRRVKSELEARIKESEDNFNKFLRTAADLDNYKKRAEREKVEISGIACENVIAEILPVLDNLERALAHAQGNHNNLEALREGVKLTIEQFSAVLQKLGLTEIKTVGEKFDPSLHHAISHEDAPDAAPGAVVREFQKGYFIKGRLLRPAMVGVAKGPEDEA